MMKLELQKFGGRGATSGGSVKGNTISMSENNKKIKINFNDLKQGDTFQIEGRVGTYNMKIGSKMASQGAYSVEGRLTNQEKATDSNTYISMLVSDERYNSADSISKRYMVPLSKTKNWKRK